MYDCFARGLSRVRASCTVPRLQVRPLVSNNEDLNSPKQSLQGLGSHVSGVSLGVFLYYILFGGKQATLTLCHLAGLHWGLFSRELCDPV